MRDLDDRVLGRVWPTCAWLPAMTTLQALLVIVLAVVVSSFLPEVSLGAGFVLSLGHALIALGLAVAAFSPKRAPDRHRGTPDH
ncbi:MAG: hypothetical protein ACXVGH_03065 [Mycobacteriales bacterium]